MKKEEFQIEVVKAYTVLTQLEAELFDNKRQLGLVHRICLGLSRALLGGPANSITERWQMERLAFLDRKVRRDVGLPGAN